MARVGVGVAVAFAVLVALWAPPAAAYVRKRTTNTFVPMFWPDPRLTLELARAPDGVGVSGDEFRDAALSAARSWSSPAISCTGVSIGVAPMPAGSQDLGRDGRNRVIMRVGRWCPEPDPNPDHCHDPAAVALTTTFSRENPGAPNDGQILEADIEINAVGDYLWGVIPDGPVSGRDYANIYDIVSVLTHETGHFIGLDHTCYLPGAELLVDDQGGVYPDCFDGPASQQSLILDATMYPFTMVSDVKVRTLTDDDKRAACEIYPPSSVPWDEWSGAGGCTTAPVPLPATRCWLSFGVTLGLAAMLMRRRRARQAAPARGAAQVRAPSGSRLLSGGCCVRGNTAERLTNLKGQRATTDDLCCQCAEEFYWSTVTRRCKPPW